MKKIIPLWLAWIVVGWTTFAFLIGFIRLLLEFSVAKFVLTQVPTAIMLYFGYYYLFGEAAVGK